MRSWKLIVNNVCVERMGSIGDNKATISTIDTLYGKGHEYVSAGENWQWVYIKMNPFVDSGVLRIAAKASTPMSLSVISDPGVDAGSPDIGFCRIGTDWQVLEIETYKPPRVIRSYFGVSPGEKLAICDAITFTSPANADLLDSIGIPVFDHSTMPLEFGGGIRSSRHRVARPLDWGLAA